MDAPGELQCVGRLEVAAPPPARYLRVGTLPVPTDSSASLPALLPSPSPTGAPRYQMLPLETDLNTLPMIPNLPEKDFPNDVKSTEGSRYDSELVNQNLSRRCEALAVSGLAEYGDEIDVIAPADIMKQIFKIPYSKAQVSIAVNRIGDTLILNTGPDVDEGEKMYRRQNNQPKGSDPSIFLNFAMHSVRAEACDCPPSYQPSQEKQTSSTVLRGPFGCRESSFDSPSSSSFSKSSYLDQSVSKSRKQSHSAHESLYLGARENKQKVKGSDPVKKSTHVGEKTKCEVQESEKSKRVGNNGFRKVCFWQFHNFHMLLGSDLLIFSNDKYVAVSLHLWDDSRQVTPLNWLEAWLDNVMASVPELAICYHQNGVVQGYELLKNDDIFLLKGVSDDGTPAFHPQVVQQNGLAVLRFLQDNCKQDPGAYWLYKGAEEDVIQLYDLSILPETHTAGDHRSPCGPMSLINKRRRESLFSLGTLLYRIAHRMSLSKVPSNRAKCAKFFRKCLDFLSEQDHLVVRACAHEQFARLILKCYEELELTSESFMIESEVTLTDLDDDSPELNFENLPSKQNELPDISENEPEVLGEMLECPQTETSETTNSLVEPSHVNNNSASSVTKDVSADSLAMCQVGTSQISKTIADAISSKLAAIHHVSQAIKSLRWNRQLQNTQDGYVDSADTIWERSVDFSLCRCGDVDCIEVCDIREWLPKSKMDHKLWKLVLLLGESYLALGEAYKNDKQLQRTLKVVELACLVYGSMPEYLDGDEFISSMSDSSVSHEDVGLKTKLVLNEADYCKNTKCFGYEVSSQQFPPNCLFWAKAWMLVGDVYAEYHRMSGNQAQVVPEQKSNDVRMSNEVAMEVKRLKRKLGKDKQNCGTCSLINCSCQSDRASSGSSASSSTPEASTLYGRKKNKKSLGRNLHSQARETIENPNAEVTQGSEKNQHGVTDTCPKKMSVPNDDVDHHHHAMENQSQNADGTPDKSHEGVSSVRGGGIFKFLGGPKPGDIEYNLYCAIHCYGAAKGALFAFPVHSAETSTILKKRGWAFNELGRCRLERKHLGSAEVAFADAIRAFHEVSDHTNVILINCNLGHGRRALAEELVSRIDEFQKYDLPESTYMQSIKAAKSDYFQAIAYYSAAKRQLAYVNGQVDKVLCNEVYTQYAHTYLRLGMLLARESFLTDSYEGGPVDESSNRTVLEISASNAFREALSTYESLGEQRKQEAAFGHFQLACYQRDLCLRFLDLVDKEVKQKNEDKYRQKSKWYGSLAEKNWQKALEFYGPKTHPTMFLNILMAQSALSRNLYDSFHSAVMLEAALAHLLEGRHVVEANEGYFTDVDLDIKPKFWSQLQSLLKSMLAASLSSCAGRQASVGPTNSGNRGEAAKLKEMYLLSLKSASLGQLHVLHKLWVS